MIQNMKLSLLSLGRCITPWWKWHQLSKYVMGH